MSDSKKNISNCAGNIGILTFHCADNYGAMLQAYGLLTWLTEQEFNARIIHYVPFALRGREWLYPYFPEKNLRRAAWRMFKGNIRKGKDWWVRSHAMNMFRKAYLTKGNRPLYSARELSHIGVDQLIVGSDQIWNPELLFGFIPAYFGAIQNNRLRKTIAYAASIGGAALPEKWETEFNGLLASVHDISMREKSAADYVEKRFGRAAAYVLDPVFLLDTAQWRKVAEHPKEKQYILYYETQPSEALRAAAGQLAKEKGLKIVDVSPWNITWKVPSQTVRTAGPHHFIGYIDAADHVVTNSFHGLALSIIFHKNFFAAHHSEVGARTENLLQCVGLTDRTIDEKWTPGSRGEIDWTQVEKKLQKERERSEDFLRRSLTE